MYVTRPLSAYRRDPSALSLQPPEGPNSGILVIQDDEQEAITTCCFGFCSCGSYQIRDLPFYQNKDLIVEYSTGSGNDKSTSTNRVIFIPVLNQPLSSNLYYCIERDGKRKGEAYSSSKEEDMKTCCFCCKVIPDTKPQPLDPQDIYQQFKIEQWGWGFTSKSVSFDGYPPNFLSRKGWKVVTSISPKLELNEAFGLNKSLRACLPSFDFSLSEENSKAIVVGKWYSPFMFIRDGIIKDQVNKSRYYEITLEQQWVKVFGSENSNNEGNKVMVDAVIEREVPGIASMETEDGVIWFKRGGNNLGLSLLVFERMKWEEERFGWVNDGNEREGVKRVEEFVGNGNWKKFGCYVLVERFVVKRMDGSFVLSYEFRHTQHLNTKWE